MSGNLGGAACDRQGPQFGDRAQCALSYQARILCALGDPTEGEHCNGSLSE
jgi:hypothetical protein